jgi:hypothetical protein
MEHVRKAGRINLLASKQSWLHTCALGRSALAKTVQPCGDVMYVAVCVWFDVICWLACKLPHALPRAQVSGGYTPSPRTRQSRMQAMQVSACLM